MNRDSGRMERLLLLCGNCLFWFKIHYLLFLIRNWHSEHNNMQLTPITQQYATFFHNTTICNGTHSTQQYPSTYSIVVSCCSRKCSASLCYATNISHYPWTQYTQTQQSNTTIICFNNKNSYYGIPLAYGTNAAASNWTALWRLSRCLSPFKRQQIWESIILVGFGLILSQ